MKPNFSWVSPKLKAGNTKYGKGVFAKQTIRKGERVIVFGGYVMTLGQLEKQSKYFQEHVYQLDDDLYFGQIKKGEMSIADYLNHSCNPNCGFKGQIIVVAMRNIKAGEEITIDYAMCASDNWRMKCLCGFKNCRKIIIGDDWEIKEGS